MKKQSVSNTNIGKGLAWVILIGIPIIAAIVYFKTAADRAMVEDQNEREQLESVHKIAVPDTSMASDVPRWTEDTVQHSNEVEVDDRPAMEAGDEDGYWDGWYDGVETQSRNRYDEECSYPKAEDRKAYAIAYREGYEKGFKEAMEKK